MSAEIRFYRHAGPVDTGLLARLRAQTPEHAARLWRPSGLAVPPGTEGRSYRVYAGFHHLRIFGNRDYAALLLARTGQVPDHVSSLFPPFFRFPFMAPGDLQIGLTRTAPGARGQGLARRAVLEAMAAQAAPGRVFWYLTEAANTASCAVIEKAGFDLAGTGRKEPGLAPGLFSAYRITDPAGAPRGGADFASRP